MHREATGVVGPNAIIQTATALHELVGAAAERSIFGAAGLARYLDHPPEAMVREGDAARLFAAILTNLDRNQSRDVLADAGKRTGQYILAHRIPNAAKTLISVLPRGMGMRLLLSAIGKHSWTFAGTGQVTIDRGWSPALTIARNPLATPGCPWHVATLEELFQSLVSPVLKVHHTSCCAMGASACRFEISARN